MSVRNLLCGLGLCLALNAAFASGGASRGDTVVFDRDFRTEEGDPSLDGFESEDRRYMGNLRRMMLVDPVSRFGSPLCLVNA